MNQGITRDRIYGEIEWAGRHARVVDTGGIVPDDPELIPVGDLIARPGWRWMRPNAIVMVVDGRTRAGRARLRPCPPAAARRQALCCWRSTRSTPSALERTDRRIPRAWAFATVLAYLRRTRTRHRRSSRSRFATLTFPETESSVEPDSRRTRSGRGPGRTTEPTANSSSTKPRSPLLAAPTWVRARCSMSSPALRGLSFPRLPAPRATRSMR